MGDIQRSTSFNLSINLLIDNDVVGTGSATIDISYLDCCNETENQQDLSQLIKLIIMLNIIKDMFGGGTR